MTYADEPKPADKVWAMYDGKYPRDWIIRGKWYEISEDHDKEFFRIANDRSLGSFGWNGWKRHVGPTPPDETEPATRELPDPGQARDSAPASGWIAHGGGKRKVRAQLHLDEGGDYDMTLRDWFAGQVGGLPSGAGVAYASKFNVDSHPAKGDHVEWAKWFAKAEAVHRGIYADAMMAERTGKW